MPLEPPKTPVQRLRHGRFQVASADDRWNLVEGTTLDDRGRLLLGVQGALELTRASKAAEDRFCSWRYFCLLRDMLRTREMNWETAARRLERVVVPPPYRTIDIGRRFPPIKAKAQEGVMKREVQVSSQFLNMHAIAAFYPTTPEGVAAARRAFHRQRKTQARLDLPAGLRYYPRVLGRVLDYYGLGRGIRQTYGNAFWIDWRKLDDLVEYLRVHQTIDLRKLWWRRGHYRFPTAGRTRP